MTGWRREKLTLPEDGVKRNRPDRHANVMPPLSFWPSAFPAWIMATTFDPRTMAGAISWRIVPPLAAALALGLGLLASMRYLARPLAVLILAITIERRSSRWSRDSSATCGGRSPSPLSTPGW